MALRTLLSAFPGHLEVRTLQCCVDHDKAGSIMFVVTVVSGIADQGAAAIMVQGATEVVLPGHSVITSYREAVPADVQHGCTL